MICFASLRSPWGCKDAPSPASAVELCWGLFLQPLEETESEERCGPAAGQAAALPGKADPGGGGHCAGDVGRAVLSSLAGTACSGAQGALGEGPETKPHVLT